MNFSRLEKNLTDNIKEAQIKLGYDGRPMSLNYMTVSLNHLIGAECTESVLAEFAEYAQSRLGKIDFRAIRDGWCITVPAEGTSYVNNLTGYEFMTELVSAVRNHGVTMEQVLDIFRRYSDNLTVKEIRNDEFDLLVYGVDDYCYCLTDEGCHVTYHRFIREDYEDLGF
ncbi:MAG: DUF3877 family protein [Ruminococcus flavefaciens]|nr:DUF3877 family protein [Ruminococcus flavefaciens]MCM1228975.1 DUF3877 family protein [Ruminococcus flavefaciens]